jgi:hypothetical protein
MDAGDSVSSGLVHDVGSSVMADAVNATDTATSEYCVIYFVLLSVHCLIVVSEVFNSFRGSLPLA